ncbi:ThuA domain-containing protein [Tundrisphaera sp. TA3]|uniref:ThuA domain-containing protein n=1 Tax=Tundrisphaera sp. TA3 TaxID=3435775 RepID=UPI003EB944AD
MRAMGFAVAALAALGLADAAGAERPIKALIITGDTHPAHNWKETTPVLKDQLTLPGKVEVDVTTNPAKDLTDENLAKYDVLLLNYKDHHPSPETTWSDANKAAFLKAVHDGGKGVVLIHHASSSFVKPNWAEFEKAIAGGWRTQGFHGPAHAFAVKKTAAEHPISAGAPAEFAHVKDELYQNCMVTPGSTVLATAYSDPAKPKGTGKDEAVIWVNAYGKGRIFENVLGHDAATLLDPGVQTWNRRGLVWAATGDVPSDIK